ncbi:TIGR02757 family protein [Desulfuromonas sp. KJ2020]|uniref:TIGR02757 family protein n=1 Tax=Desulfuromonas sp. KJ2020 TaxID=2919173 RepID=UPI0020A7ECF5|nr:TIGR02757 family protein [Desulfuromonas sp. KJ2020]MCP3177182.1 TIGR02757 family protein [Desulfuromonas sp. KJ2020]
MMLQDILEKVQARSGPDFLQKDPVRFPRQFSSFADQEAVAFVSAALAYGQVGIILRHVEDLIGRMGKSPADFIANFTPRRDAAYLRGFKHRFNDAKDLACLFWLMRGMIETAGSLENFFGQGDDGGATITSALASFCRRALAQDVTPFYAGGRLPARAGVRYFFPSPEGGSACKRLCMFLRWVVRPDDGIDLGLWTTIAPARLVLPLDTHTGRISRLLGLSARRTADWKMALEVTERLRAFDASDPVRFDFALAHLGISEGCRGRQGEVCRSCAVASCCLCGGGPPEKNGG